jgi:hypothetical protein
VGRLNASAQPSRKFGICDMEGKPSRGFFDDDFMNLDMLANSYYLK